MVRRNNIVSSVDWLSVFIWVLMVAFGWMNIYSVNIMEGADDFWNIDNRYVKQLIWIGASLVLIILVFIMDAKFYAFFAYPLYGLIIIVLIGVFLFGKEINGARSWFVLGGFQLQPSEFAKPFTALALARLLSSHGFNLKDLKSLILAGAIIFAPAALILIQPDMGSTLVYFAFLFVLYREGFSQNIMILGAALILLFIATLLIEKSIIILVILLVSLILIRILLGARRVPFILILSAAISFGIAYGINYFFRLEFSLYAMALVSFGLVLAVGLIMAFRIRNSSFYKVLLGMFIGVVFMVSVDYMMNNILKEHQTTRIYVTLGMKDDPQGVGYNLHQSKIAIGSGGFSGKGFLEGTQTKLHFVPEQGTDFIFCTVGEEWGFVGTTIVVLLFVLLIVRLVILAERQRSHFSRIFGYSLVSVILVHFTVNIGMTIGLLPVIGIPLPFFSYGGSSMLAFSIFLFIFLKLDSHRMDLLR